MALVKQQVKPLSVSPSRRRSDADIIQRFEQNSYDADVTLNLAEDFVLLDGSSNTVTATLETPTVGGIMATLKATDVSNAVDVDTEDDGTIDGSSSYTFTTAEDAIVLISDSGGDWNIVSEFTNV